MQMNPGIILSGQNPNFLQTMGQAAQVAGATNAVQDQNALRGLYREQGPGIMAGEQGAMNALAQLDPMQAAQFQQNREQSDMARERLSMARQAAARAAETHVAQMDAVTRQKEAEDLDRTLSRLAMANDPQSWDAFAQEVMPEAVGQFGQRDMILAQGLGLKDVLAMQKGADEPAAIQALRIRAREAGLEPGTPAYEEFMRRGGSIPQNMMLRTNPDGSTEFYQGEGQGPNAKTTEGEKSAAGYLSRMRAAENLLDDMGETTRSIASYLVAGTNVEGLVLSGEQERILQAQRDWVRAKLRKESGAVIGPEEMAEEIRTYFPLPGEDPETVAQKRQARKQAERQFEIMSGPAAGEADSQAPVAPQPGVTEDGYRFLGGDPGDPENWQKVE